MSLDLGQTVLQIDRLASDLKVRQGDRERRLQRALEAVRSFDAAGYEDKRQKSAANLAWRVPGVTDDPAAGYAPAAPPQDFCVAAVDGSHIDVDRHLSVRCFLVNIGVSVLTYGSNPDALLSNQPRLYARDDELVLRDRNALHRAQNIEGVVLGAKRTVEEVRALVDTVRGLPPDLPTLAMLDGTLLMLGLVGQGYEEYVRRELIEEGFVRALDDFRRMSGERPLAVASYISLPRSAEVVNGLRLAVCPYGEADCDRHCGRVGPGNRPCDTEVGGLMDREIWSEVLQPGERSAVFESSSQMVEKYYREHGLSFFYVHAGEEIGRVEVPAWVAADEALLGLAHSLVLDQCRKGPGYPVALMEAHEQAVVTGGDRQAFVEMVEEAISDQRMPVYTSEKNRSKRLRWL
jgi:GNAT superfamily N-acetyltransferase